MGEPNEWRARFDGAKHSVVYIQFAPLPGMANEIQRLADRVRSIEDEQERRLAVRSPSTCVGFVHSSTNGDDDDAAACHLNVMTTAHALKHVYSWADPLTIEKARLFRASVVCYHREEARRLSRLPEESRRYVEAKITASSWAHDILLLTVGVEALRSFHAEVCPGPHPHPALPVAPKMPRKAMRCMLLTWPEVDGPPRDAMGWTSCSRGVEMMSTNHLGYRMILVEVDVDSVAGMSGAPLVDADGMVIGMLHGGFGGTHSYFVACPHLYQWARQNRTRTRIVRRIGVASSWATFKAG
ncbi:uncharacterized protein LOC123398127 [Hordeum vulgare subsp. vulgare]|uniref:uncharacterized protein LOC123398127 n=1 Tax=Hordeum vulgare subsp. vulgare TaxID=112509 RepID=UPI000B488EAE|nr:uncharacterized protein LOC123398127 [Hordeum vulgare subsp. vulgare]